MFKLIVLIATHLCFSSCYIFNEFNGPLLSSLRVHNRHILHKRQTRPAVEHVWADNYYNKYNYDPIEPQPRKIYSVAPSKNYKEMNEEKNAIINEPKALPPLHFSPEAYSDNIPHTHGPNPDILSDNTTINDSDLISILNDLSDCVELNTIHTLRLCPIKKESHKAKHFSRFESLTDEELEAYREKKCKTVKSILQHNVKESEDSVKENIKTISDDNDSNKVTSGESITLSSDESSIANQEHLEQNLISVSLEPDVQESSNILDVNKKTEDITELNIGVKANIDEKDNPEDAKHTLATEKTELLSQVVTMKKTEGNLISNSTLHPASSSDYDTTTISVDKFELDNALLDLFDPAKENIGFESNTQHPENDIKLVEPISSGTADKIPEVNKLQTDAAFLNDSDHIKSNDNIYKNVNIDGNDNIGKSGNIDSSDNIDKNDEISSSSSLLSKDNNDNIDSNSRNDNNVSETPLVSGRRSFQRPRVNENEVPVIKIITHEYPDGNVVSKVNGTEVLVSDSPSAESYTNVFVKNIKVQGDHNVSQVLYKFSIPKHNPEKNGETELMSQTLVSPEKRLNGRLYLVHNNERIAAQFIQESDGNINIGLDILSVCENENHNSNSTLFKILCNCKNCSLEKN